MRRRAGVQRVLVVGCGSIGQRHARLLSARKDISVWVCDPLESNLIKVCKQATVGRQFKDYKEALQESPEFVWVCTPERLHADVSVAALEHGAHVLCEKPLADTLASAQEIKAAVAKSEKTFAVGFTLRFTKAFRTLKSLLDKKEIGNIVGGQACLGGYDALVCATTDAYLKQEWGLLLAYAHEFDYLRWFLGPVEKATGFHACLGQMDKKPDPNIVSCALQFASGPLVTLHMDYVQRPGQRSLMLVGDRGRISYSTLTNRITVFKYATRMCRTLDVAQERDRSFMEEHNQFFRAARGETDPIVDINDAFETMRTIYMLIDSLKKHS